MTINDVIDYIFLHPDGYTKVFKGWKESEVAQAIKKAIEENCFAWSEKDGKIDGIVLAKKKEDKRLHIIGILVSSKAALRGMLEKYYEMYPEWTLVGNRNGKLVEFSKHLKLLWNLKSTYH
jgi:hypothetical protein